MQHTEKMKQGKHMDKICREDVEQFTVKQPVYIVAAVRYNVAANSELKKTAMA
jgi:hypothetical protein